PRLAGRPHPSLRFRSSLRAVPPTSIRSSYAAPRDLPSFPTRRSSYLLDAGAQVDQALPKGETPLMLAARTSGIDAVRLLLERGADRKSTRLNSSHVKSSYAVFCLKKTILTVRVTDTVEHCLSGIRARK